MRFQAISSAFALVGFSSALTDSSPWIMLSTSPLESTTDTKQFQSAPEVLQNTRLLLNSCPTEKYFLVNQRGMTTADLRRTTFDTSALPSLTRIANDVRTRGKYVISEVVGSIQDMDEVGDTGLVEFIRDACALQGKDVEVDSLDLSSLPRDSWASALAQNDEYLAQRLAGMTDTNSYTILFMSTPGEPNYEAEFEDSVQMDFKRDVQGQTVRRNDNETDWNRLPLFEKYQFFTPGIFMGIIVALVLFSILGVGIKALASLEVSYGAFEKENGPAAQKKP